MVLDKDQREKKIMSKTEKNYQNSRKEGPREGGRSKLDWSTEYLGGVGVRSSVHRCPRGCGLKMKMESISHRMHALCVRSTNNLSGALSRGSGMWVPSAPIGVRGAILYMETV